MALSLAGDKVVYGILIPIAIILVAIILINILQTRNGDYVFQSPCWQGIKVRLPRILTNWNFLPLWMHSLDPADKLLRKIGSIFCGCCAERFSFLSVKPQTPEKKENVDSGYENFGGTGSENEEGNANHDIGGDVLI